MKEHPILFSGPMVKAILDGRKSQARRVVRPQPNETKAAKYQVIKVADYFTGCPQAGLAYYWSNQGCWNSSESFKCRYQVGDKPWVQEIWGVAPCYNELRPSELCLTARQVSWKADDGTVGADTYHRNVDKWRLPVHMPKWAARIWLEITGIRVERVQDIDNDWEDCLKEGVVGKNEACCEVNGLHIKVLWKFRDHWNSLNKKRGFGYDENPWVYIIEFKKI